MLIAAKSNKFTVFDFITISRFLKSKYSPEIPISSLLSSSVLFTFFIVEDYYGRWKMAQYAIKDSFAPVIITGNLAGNILKVYVISDLLATKYDVKAKIQIYNWNSFKTVHETIVSITLVIYPLMFGIFYSLSLVALYCRFPIGRN